MYKLYFSDRVLIIDDDATKYGPDEAYYVAPSDPLLQKAKLLQKVQNTKRCVLVTEDPEGVYRAITESFPSIGAGGGLVLNSRGEILMIYRHRRWDLPKGKQEPGEHIQHCAVREVEEETGISDLKCERELCVTNHFYRLDGEWVMKKTTWYLMRYDGSEPLVPQAEEDITGIEWVNPGKLDEYLRTTYSTIVDVFEAAGYRIR